MREERKPRLEIEREHQKLEIERQHFENTLNALSSTSDTDASY